MSCFEVTRAFYNREPLVSNTDLFRKAANASMRVFDR